jgi:hypothetical protein
VGGVVRRLDDEMSRKLVKEGKATFCQKSEWKKLQPKKKTFLEEAQENKKKLNGQIIPIKEFPDGEI